MLEILSAIALGRPAFGLYPVEEGRVVFLTGDDPTEVVIDRLLMLNAEDVDGKRVLDPAVKRKLAANIDVRALNQVVTLRNRDVMKFMIDVTGGSTMTVLDPLRHFIGEADENKAHEIYAQLAPLRQLAEDLPCAMVVIHHSKKESGGGASAGNKLNDYRGSGALRGLSRAQLIIERLNHGIDPPRIGVVGENRYGKEPPALQLEIHMINNVLRWVQPKMAEAVLGVIKMAGKPITTAEILTNFGDPPSTIRAIIYRLRDRGLIQADKVGSAVAWTITTRIDTAIAAVQKHSTRAQRKRTESL